MQYFVDQKAAAGGDGSKEKPFRKIQEAADMAKPGDEVVVMPGIYREAISPAFGGTEQQPIVYRSAQPLQAVITGAEPVTGWEKQDGGYWKASVSNDMFTYENPYTTLVQGDWYIADALAHTGEVYLGEDSLYEVDSLEGVCHPVKALHSWEQEKSLRTWYTEQNTEANETILYANFGEADPNAEQVEINARPFCFFPKTTGINYITLSGFTICRAATQWAPPTAFQSGMVGPHWSKGWVIEDCEIYQSKCSGISLGKYKQQGNDNKWLTWKLKDGTQTERECILQAQREGWSKETVGSHTVRCCHIHHCGQTGIVGHLGGVFSLIEDNHIHHINVKQNLAGAEIGGIKMHAAIDVIFRRNHIHHCTRGLWLDWQAQGTRVTQNLFHHNTLPIPDEQIRTDAPGMGEDIFIEVSHGPTLLDNNLLLSDRSVKLATQGVAMVHNLVAGALTAVGMGTDNGALLQRSPRYTPYHVPHRTEVAGFMTFLHGDMRFYNNIFVQQPIRPGMQRMRDFLQGEGKNQWDDGNLTVGTFPYNGYPLYEKWMQDFEGYCGMGTESDRYYKPLPVWAAGNVYVNGAKPWEKEESPQVADAPVSLRLLETDKGWHLETNLFDVVKAGNCPLVDTALLGMAFEPEQLFENPDGSPLTISTDYFGKERGNTVLPGPFSQEAEGKDILL